MTIKNSQGKSIDQVRFYFPNPVFSHRQLYIALSRVASVENLFVSIHQDKEKGYKTSSMVNLDVLKMLIPG